MDNTHEHERNTIIRSNDSSDFIDNNLSDNNIQDLSFNNSLHYQSDKQIEKRIIYVSFAIYTFVFSLIFILNRNNNLHFANYSYLYEVNKNHPAFSNEREINNYHLNETSSQNSSQISNLLNHLPINKNINVSSNVKTRSLFTKYKEINEELRLKENIFKDLFRHSYLGNWTSDSKIMGFENTSGEIRIIIHLATNFRFRDIFLSYIIFLYDGVKREKWIIIENKLGISLNNTKIENINDLEKLEIKHSNMLVVASEYKIFDNIQKNFLSLNMNYFLDKSIISNITGKIDNMIFSKAGFTINYSVSRERISFFAKIASLSVFLCLIGIIQTINSRKLIESFERNPELAKNYSPVIFYISNIWNAFISFGYFYLSLMDERLFNNLIIPTLLFFLNFSYLELKIILSIWKSEIPNRSTEFTTMFILRNRFTKFYILFYMMIVILFTFIYDYFLNRYFQYFITAITFLPQIIQDLKKGTKNKISFGTILAISCNRLFIPIYFRSCPKNFLGIPVDYEFSYILCMLIIIQVLIMIIQKLFKIKFVYRRTLGKNEYKYEKTAKDLKSESIDLETATCAICLGEFVTKKDNKKENTDNSLREIRDKNINSNLETSSLDFPIPRENYPFYIRVINSFKSFFKRCFESKKKEFMLTPCKHLFHRECLRLWMEKKNGCPVCRHDLPQYND